MLVLDLFMQNENYYAVVRLKYALGIKDDFTAMQVFNQIWLVSGSSLNLFMKTILL